MTKKSSLFFISFLLLNTVVFSQGFHIGAKFGTDIQKIKGSNFSEKFAYGDHLGAFAELKLNKTYTIQPEFYYSSVNLNIDSNLSTISSTITLSKLKLGYINIPLLLNINASKLLAFQVGPRYGIIVNKDKSIRANTKDAFKSGDFSMVAGVQFAISKVRIYGRYQIGLSDINETGNKAKWKSETIHIGVGLTIL